MINPKQLKAGRALLGWTQAFFAKKAGVAISTVADFERGLRTPTDENLKSFGRTLDAAGVSPFCGGVVFNKKFSEELANRK